MGANGHTRDWASDLATLDLGTSRPPPRNLPSHVHAIAARPRREAPAPAPMPLVQRRGPAPPVVFGTSPYPDSIRRTLEEDDPNRDPHQDRRRQAHRPPREGLLGDALDVGALDLRPSYPTDEGEDVVFDDPPPPAHAPVPFQGPPVPLQGPPPPAPTRRQGVRPLSADPAAAPPPVAAPVSADHVVQASAADLIGVFTQAAFHAGQLQELLARAAQLLALAVPPVPTPTPEPPPVTAAEPVSDAPEIQMEAPPDES